MALKAIRFKAIRFAQIGVVNTAVDYVVFLAARWYLTTTIGAAAISWVVSSCYCGTQENVTLVVANTFSWLVAVSGSYVMNSTITFAAESGRQLRLAAYAKFLASGILGYLANTTTLVIVAQFLPDWMAKGVAILASFLVNFSMSHFVVFRARRPPVDETQ